MVNNSAKSFIVLLVLIQNHVSASLVTLPSGKVKRFAQMNLNFNGAIGSHQENDCSYPGACTDQNLGTGQAGSNQGNNNHGGNTNPNNQYPNNQYPNNGQVATGGNNGGSHDGFGISMNGAIGSTHYNDCNYSGACTDQTLSNQYPNNQYPNNQYPNNQYPNNQYPNNQTPNNQYPNNQYPNNGAVTSNNGGSHNGFDISMNGAVGSTYDNDCNHAGACTDQTLANRGPGFLKLTTESGVSCGGWYIVAEICRGNNDCCEEQIVTGTQGFKGGETIQTKLQQCKNFVISSTTAIQQNRLHLTAKLTGWNDITKSSTDSFCPGNLEITTINGAKLKGSFPSKRVSVTKRINLMI